MWSQIRNCWQQRASIIFFAVLAGLLRLGNQAVATEVILAMQAVSIGVSDEKLVVNSIWWPGSWTRFSSN